MKLLLVRHGTAEPGGGDPPLTAKGRNDIQRLASFLARSGTRATRVIHSPLRRARETALLLARVIGPGPVVEESAIGLLPEDSTDAVYFALDDWQGDIMLVGHMPFLGALASRLLTGRQEPDVVAFERGAVVCLERDDGDRHWFLSWSVGPSLIGQ